MRLGPSRSRRTPRAVAVLAAAGAALLALTACGSSGTSASSSTATTPAVPSASASAVPSAPESSSPSGTLTVASAYGDVEVPADPQRVAGVSYNTPWQLQSLGVTPIATIDYSNWLSSYTPEQQAFIADAKPIGTYGEINFEALSATEPDLIIGDASEVDEATYQRLSTIAPTVIVGGGTRGDWQSITEQTAAALGKSDTWAASKAAYEQLRDTTKATYADVINGNRWINFSFGNDAGQFSVQLPTGDTGNLIVNEMGIPYGPGAQLEDTDGSGYASLPLEQLPTVFDDVTVALTFVQADGTSYDGITAITESPLFQSLDVATSGQIYGLSTSVTDYETAMDWINELTTKVLEPLSA